MRFVFILTCSLGLLLTASLRATAADQVFLEKDAALDLVLGRECERKYDPHKLDDDFIRALEEKDAWTDGSGDSTRTAHFFVCSKNGSVSGYALIDQEVGKHQPITYIVGLTPEGTVSRVEIMVFREIRGGEVRRPDFVAQYQHKTFKDRLTVGEQITNIAGATYSTRSISRGVRRALLAWQHFYRERVL